MIELIKEDDDSNILSTDHSLNVPLHYEVSSIRVPECFENVKLIFQMLALCDGKIYANKKAQAPHAHHLFDEAFVTSDGEPDDLLLYEEEDFDRERDLIAGLSVNSEVTNTACIINYTGDIVGKSSNTDNIFAVKVADDCYLANKTHICRKVKGLGRRRADISRDCSDETRQCSAFIADKGRTRGTSPNGTTSKSQGITRESDIDRKNSHSKPRKLKCSPHFKALRRLGRLSTKKLVEI